MNNYKVVLITGSAGFIGSSLAKKFLLEGFKVFGVDNINDYYETEIKFKRLKQIESCAIINNGYWKFYKASIEDKNYMEIIFKNCQPDIVVNLAAQAGVRYSINNPEVYFKSNLIGFFNILELCKTFQIKHLIYASSSSVYGGNKIYPFSESQRICNPMSFYAATKISNEVMANAYSEIYNLSITGLRYFTVYGPWGRPDMAPMIFAKNILSRKPITIFNYGRMSRDFTFISDIVNGTFMCCLKSPKEIDSSNLHKVFNIGNGKPVDLLNFIEILENAFQIKSIKVFEEMQPGDVEKTWADTSSLYKWVGYEPKVNLEEGIPLFAKWYMEYYQ